MISFKKFLLLGFLSLLAVDAAALQAVMTHNVFHAPENNGLKPYIELFWEIDPRTLLFDKKDEKWIGKIKTDIVLYKDKKVVTGQHYILQTTPIADVKDLYLQRIMDIKRFSVDTGTYTLEVVLTDEIKKGSEYKYNKQIRIPYTSQPFFSDIQLIDTLAPSSGESMYNRNNQLQIPLFTNFLDDHRKQIKYYTELYNAHNTDAAKEIRTFISKKENSAVIYNLCDTGKVVKQQLSALYGSLDLSVLSSGNYYLNTALYDENEKVLAHKSLFFQLINSAPVAYMLPADTASGSKGNKPAYFNLDKIFLSKYNPEQIVAILRMLFPIADPTERQNINEFLKRPDDMYSRYFVYNFWLKRNSANPEEEWKNYAEKVKKVNKNFGNGLVKGYESERGRVYLKYGEPTERVQVQNEEGAFPYEVWRYAELNGQGDVLFLFYRPGLMGSDYRQLTSTANGELQNRNWRRDLYLNGTAGNANSRAEQYFINR